MNTNNIRLNINCVQYLNIIRITYYSYSYSGTILNPNIIRIHIRPTICARILFVFVFAHSEKKNIIRIRIRFKFWFRILFVFGQNPDSEYYSYSYSVQKTVFADLWSGTGIPLEVGEADVNKEDEDDVNKEKDDETGMEKSSAGVAAPWRRACA